MSLEGLQLGQYRLQRLLGTGGMGEVYLAEDPRISQQVAIKVSRTEASTYPNSANAQEAIRLFQREAKAIARLDHPHILPLFGYGEESIQGATCTYLVMPFRREGSLADWLRQRNDQELIAPQDVAAFIVQAADALQYAHDNQIIHQDVKPSNFLLRARRDNPHRPDLLLADFGIARMSSATSSMSHTVRGTPTYMAPEQWSGEPVPATDQYALAVMVYELLTGRPPFMGRQEQVMYQHFQVEPQRPGALNPRLPSTVDSVLLRALAKKPTDRFPTIADFAQALQQALLTAPPVTPAIPPSPLSSLPPPLASSNNDTAIRATLAISKEEAQQGTMRTLTLPGGRKVTVTIPKGAQNGQILYLNGQDGSPNPGMQGDALILTLSVPQSEESLQSPASPESNAQTVRASNTPASGFAPAVNAPNSSSHQSASHQNEVSANATATNASSNEPVPSEVTSESSDAAKTVPMPQSNVTEQDAPKTEREEKKSPIHSRSKATRVVLLSVLAVLVIGGSLYGLVAYQNNVKQLNNQATLTAETASVVAANPDPYSQKFPTLAIYDPLDDSSNSPVGWDSSDGCNYNNGTYHAIEQTAYTLRTCSMNGSSFDNFVFEAQMTILQGDCGGLHFRNGGGDSNAYDFVVCQDGTYSLSPYVGNNQFGSPLLSPASASAIQTGLGQTNTLVVVADGNSFTLFVNNETIGTATDSSLIGGAVGVIAYHTSSDATEVAYSKVRIWTA